MQERTINVLLVEDNPEMTILLKRKLARATNPFFHINHADTLQGGLELIAQGGHEVVLLDLGLPDSRGLDTFLQVHKHAETLPIVILTAVDNDAIALETVQKGAQDYLIKGQVDDKMLWRILCYAIERKRIERLLEEKTTALEKSNQEIKESHERLQNTQQKLVQAEKLASIGLLAGGVAHELKNPLAVILLGMDFLQHNISGADKVVSEMIQRVKDSVQRADEVIRGLVDFASPSPPKAEKVNMAALLERTLAVIEHLLKVRNIAVKKEFDPDLPLIQTDPNQMQIVFINLLVNGAQAMPDGGTLSISVRRFQNPADGKNPDPSMIEVVVADTGIGIAPENLMRIFDPFFTTKRGEKNIGLGLSLVRGIIEKHGGEIVVESEVKKGTRMIVHLPVENRGTEDVNMPKIIFS